MSSADIAIVAMPPRPNVMVVFHKSCQIASTALASLPMTRGMITSSRQAMMDRIPGRNRNR
jgi:hypothetical protein